MVQRTDNSSKKFDEFEGKVVLVELTEGLEGRKQYHLKIEPIGFKVGGATGHIHEWIPLSPKATQEAIPQGSVMDRFLQQVELCVGKQARDARTVNEAMMLLQGKKFRFVKMKLGKDFEGKAARDYAVPAQILS